MIITNPKIHPYSAPMVKANSNEIATNNKMGTFLPYAGIPYVRQYMNVDEAEVDEEGGVGHMRDQNDGEVEEEEERENDEEEFDGCSSSSTTLP